MAEMMRLGPDRGSRLPILPLLVILLPLASAYGTLKYVQTRTLRPLNERLAAMKKAADVSQTDQDKIERDVEKMKREVAALQAIAKVEILWGGELAEGEKKGKPVDAKDTKIDFAFTHQGGVWVNPRATNGTIWYYTDEGETIARISAQSRVLGAYWLWPILAEENNLKVTGTEPLAAGQMLRIPAKIVEYQIRHAITEAGAPDKARDEIFAQAGLKP